MNIVFSKLYRTEGRSEPCAVSLPFRQGDFPAGTGLKLRDGEKELPVQLRVDRKSVV